MGEFHGNQHVNGNSPDVDYDDLREAVVSFTEERGEPPTTEQAANDERFPSIATIYKILDGSWNDLLDDAGFERGHVGEYGPESEAEMLQDMRSVVHDVESEYLTTRQYAERGMYSDDTIKRRFGSWREACERASIDAGTKYGISCDGPQGATLDSLLELKVATFLNDRGIAYEVHPVLESTTWVSDLYLPTFELWVEVNGFADQERPNASDFERKLEYYDEHGMDCVVVESSEALADELQDRRERR